MSVPARRLPSWIWVTGLTTAAIVGVTALAAQADQGAHPTAAHAAGAKPSASTSPHPSASPKKSEPVAVPDGSGTGRRIVYSLAQRRVWLVDTGEAVRRTFAVWPGTVSPAPGRYAVSTTVPSTTGTDGTKVENIVYFTVASGVNIAFSNAQDGSSPQPAAGVKTGGIRMHSADGDAVWAFGTKGTKVSVTK
ncbi:hypothetical protein ACFWBS_33545 [Streptomyces mirabilis]|uniref:hypothetical protein n=1 Tax=Streptomyces TaxID=1883 RepID=UPI000BE2B319|nr:MULTISPECIES: hypothetical protein [Streptomyces]MCX4609760.1 hypothetical protein [Streptomyces mirabilis]